MVLVVPKINWKKYFSKNNLITLGLIVLVLLIQGPNWISNFQVTQKKIPETEFLNLLTQEQAKLNHTQKYIMFFWASWCAPCKLEMHRYQKSIENGQINKNQFIAINPFEDLRSIKKFIADNKFDFQFWDDYKIIGDFLGIQATPTVTFVENMQVVHQSTGISLIGIFRAEYFLK